MMNKIEESTNNQKLQMIFTEEISDQPQTKRSEQNEMINVDLKKGE
jgi:hypothetical protein